MANRIEFFILNMEYSYCTLQFKVNVAYSAVRITTPLLPTYHACVPPQDKRTLTLFRTVHHHHHHRRTRPSPTHILLSTPPHLGGCDYRCKHIMFSWLVQISLLVYGATWVNSWFVANRIFSVRLLAQIHHFYSDLVVACDHETATLARKSMSNTVLTSDRIHHKVVQDLEEIFVEECGDLPLHVLWSSQSCRE